MALPEPQRAKSNYSLAAGAFILLPKVKTKNQRGLETSRDFGSYFLKADVVCVL
jgi:hypothetical protein